MAEKLAAAPEAAAGVASSRPAVVPAQEVPKPSAGNSSASPAPQPRKPRVPSDALVLNTRVVTLAAVESKLDNVRRLIVPPRSVITPAVRDLLDQRHIQVVFDADGSKQESQTPSGTCDLTILLLGSRISEMQVGRILRDAAFTATCERFSCLIAATDRAADIAGANGAVAILSRHTAAACCLANRHRHVRAIVAHDVLKLPEDVAAVGANTVIVDPTPGMFVVKRTLVAFMENFGRECPEVFRERLG
ncbi:MAG: hypothetical protein D6741_02145 [Planctomycetota bacterium]|nr:MAG: hypothetical protein D6741_02145 [Planctomycetota bacterium]